MRAAAIWLGLLVLSLARPAGAEGDRAPNAGRSAVGPAPQHEIPRWGAQARKYRIFVVSSYHRAYLWSQDTNRGLCAGLLEFGLLDDAGQAAQYTRTDRVESSCCVVRKTWMDTKHKNSAHDLAVTTTRVMAEIAHFAPDLVLLGDDNAANYIGNQLIDTEVPVVFWGVNGLPLKYGLLDSLDHPGHNITGVNQPGYLKECLVFLQRLVPHVRTFAILADDSETGRAKVKALENLADTGVLPLTWVKSVRTNSLEEWKAGALALQDQVDAFFVTNHNTLRDAAGHTADPLDVGAWYLRTIHRPECADEKQFAQEGMLCVCDDSGYNQGYEAMKLAARILQKGEHPRDIAVHAPARGPFIVNRQRARALGIDLTKEVGTQEYIETSLALERNDR